MTKLSIVTALLASTALTLPAFAQSHHQGERKHTHHVRICTGSPSGNYTKVGAHLVQQFDQLDKNIKVEIINTGGSVDNLKRIADGECEVGLAQNDAINNYMQDKPETKNKIGRMQELYQETVHFLFNRRLAAKYSIDRVPNIRGKKEVTIAVGEAGSGHNETWRSIIKADAKYNEVRKEFIGGTDAIEAISGDGSEAAGMIYTGGLKSGDMMKWNTHYGKQVVMLGFDDGDLTGIKDERGNVIYSMTEIPAGTYRNLQPSGTFGSHAVKTAKVGAFLIFNQDWRRSDHGKKAYNVLIDAKNNIAPKVKAEMNPPE